MMGDDTKAGVGLHFGTVSAVDEKTMRVRVRLDELDNMRTDWLPVGVQKSKKDKDYWLPDEGEHVAVLLDNYGETGIVLCAVYSDQDAVPVASRDKWCRRFSDGATLEYDRASHELTVSGATTVNVQAATVVNIKSPEILLDGHVTVTNGMSGSGGASFTGNVSIEGNVSASGSVMDGGGNSNHHSH